MNLYVKEPVDKQFTDDKAPKTILGWNDDEGEAFSTKGLAGIAGVVDVHQEQRG